MTTLILAQINGTAVVRGMIWLIIIGVVFWLLWWLLNYVAPPEPFRKVGQVILAIAAVIVLINFLMSLVGQPFIRWW